jgi:hypothetical protein
VPRWQRPQVRGVCSDYRAPMSTAWNMDSIRQWRWRRELRQRRTQDSQDETIDPVGAAVLALSVQPAATFYARPLRAARFRGFSQSLKSFLMARGTIISYCKSLKPASVDSSSFRTRIHHIQAIQSMAATRKFESRRYIYSE